MLAPCRPLVRQHPEAGVPSHPVDVGVEERHEIGEPGVERRRIAKVDPLRLAERGVNVLVLDVMELNWLKTLALFDGAPETRARRSARRASRA